MRRIIEELVEKRKLKQANLKESLLKLSRLFDEGGFFSSFFKRNRSQFKDVMVEINDNINELMTSQDKEWDAYSNNHSTMVFKSLEWKIGKLEAEYSNVKTLLSNFITLEKSLTKLIDSIDTKSSSMDEVKQSLMDVKDQLSTYRYSDFEQRFRGDDQKVKEKLTQYLPIFSDTNNGVILDIGCGRGEFMELLQAENKQTEGIDVSLSMLQVAQEKGLNCSRQDALAFLKQKEDQSIAGIFSAQVIEHLEPEYLREVILEAFRVLKPEAPVVLETVNPLSLFALSNIYFLDVTHVKPLHPEFMRYLLESSGFGDVSTMYPEVLQAEQLEGISPENHLAREFNTNVDKLNKLLYASPVYAVIGKKK